MSFLANYLTHELRYLSIIKHPENYMILFAIHKPWSMVEAQ